MLDRTGGPAARMAWSTKPRHSDQPFGNWADNVAAALVRMEPRKISDDPFEGMISRVDVAPIQISLVKATKHTVLRLHSHIVGGTDDLCLINLQLEGLGCTTQRGREQISAPGLSIVTATIPTSARSLLRRNLTARHATLVLSTPRNLALLSEIYLLGPIIFCASG